jgi:hypothetical protein
MEANKAEEKVYSVEELRKVAPFYRGKPENFDPKKIGKKTPPKPRLGPKSPNATPPSRLGLSQTPTPQRNEPIISEAILGVDITVHEIEPRQNFEANYSKLPDITVEVYNSIAVDENQLDRKMAKEELCCYTTGLLWMRLLEVKAKQPNVALTSEEKAIRKSAANEIFNVPQPIYAYLQEIGTFTDKMGKETELNIPDLPIQRAGGLGGYHAPEINAETHTLLEEVPSLGIAANMVMALTSQRPEPNVNFRVGFPPRTRATNNLVGTTSPIGERRTEIRQNLARFGITMERFPEYVANTRFNLRYLRHISDLLGSTETFRLERVCFKNLSPSGGESQVIFTKPTTTTDPGSWKDKAVQSTASSTSSTAHIGASYVFGFQLYKSDGPGETSTERAMNWSCAEAIPGQAWTDNRNDRRNVPEGVGTERFRGPTLEEDNVTQRTVRRMIKTPR